MSRTILAGARLDDGRLVDVTIGDGMVEVIEAAGPPDAGAVDLGGRLLCPAFVDGHIHLDKTLLGMPWQPHLPGETVATRIAAEKTQLAGALPVADRAAALVRQVIAHGTTRLRCHVDVDPEMRLANLHAVLAVRTKFADSIDIEVVAFPQSGILVAPGTADLLDAALVEGATVVGGLDPAGIDGDLEGHLSVVFGLALRRAAPIDIHLHDPGALGAFTLRRIAARTRAAGLQGRVAVSHAYALGAVATDEFASTADALAEAGVAIMTNGPGTSPMPPVAALAARGVTVFAGSDNIRDAWSPYGNGCMLERAMIIGYRAGLDSDDGLRLAHAMATTQAARATGAPRYGLAVGMAADLVALDAAHVPEAVVRRPGDRWVWKRGRRIA